MSRRILIVEDDSDLAHLLELHLRELCDEVHVASRGDTGLEIATRTDFDVIILDIMLPGMDGLELCRRLRANGDFTPILMLTAKSTETDRVVGLEVGADDYLIKPFGIAELVARIRALLRRATQWGNGANNVMPARIEAGDLTLDLTRRLVTVAGRTVLLTAREFDLLAHFASHPGHVYTRTQLLDTVWGYNHEGYEHTVNSHINRLRTKIETNPAQPRFVLTVWGVGYKFTDTMPDR